MTTPEIESSANHDELVEPRETRRAPTGAAQVMPVSPLQEFGHVELQAAVMDQLNGAVVVTDLTGRVLYHNARLRETLYWVTEPLIGSMAFDVEGLELNPATIAEVAKALRAGESWDGDIELNRSDGLSVTLHASDCGLHDRQGTLVGVISTITDVTEARHSTQRLVSEASALRFLLDATTILSSALEFEECLASLARLAVPLLGDLCLIDVLVEGGVERMAVAHADPAKAALANELISYPPRECGQHPAAETMRTGVGRISPEMDDDMLRATTINSDHFRVVKELGFRSYLCAPLRARGRTLGCISLISAGSGRRFGRDDLALAEDLAARAGHVIDNARLFSEQARVSRSLQGALLPPSLPIITGVQLAAAYRAAGEGSEVGGDFYDVFEIGRGAWAAAIGDVSGRGPEAAAATGLVRHSLHASAQQNRDPTSMLGVANRVLREQEGATAERFCTAVCAILRPGSRLRVTLAGAGHPPPTVVRADGRVDEYSSRSPALGVVAGFVGASRRLVLNPGDLLVLYTDGLTEARDASGAFYGEERLNGLLSESAGLGASELVERLLSDVQAFSGGWLKDDLALLVIGPDQAG